VERKMAGESMLKALEANGIDWTLHVPWEPFKGRFEDYDAALCWSYYGGKHNIAFWARKFEQQCREAGLPIVNSIDGYFRDHSYCLAKWAEAGIPCAKHQLFQHPEDITLPYPLILRKDGQHRGRNIFLVHSAVEAREVIERQLELCAEQPLSDKHLRPLDLAIEFIDVKAPDGYYHKRRTIVVGDTLIWREAAIANHWIVNEAHLIQDEYTLKLNRQFIEEGDPNPELILAAAKALGSDMVALDYTVMPDGSYFFWEGNRHFQMYGNRDLEKHEIHPATGRTYEERVEVDMAVGRALVNILESKVSEHVSVD